MFNCSDQRTGADTKSRTPLHLLLSPTRLLRALIKSTPPPRFDRAITLLAFSLACSAGQIAQAQTIVNICDRTDAVEAGLLAAISETNDCAAVTDTMLAGITGTLNLGRSNFDTSITITSLKAGDFDGLTGLTTLAVHNQGLTTLPEGIFNDLTALTDLQLNGNKLTTLPEGIFNDLTALTDLRLGSNNLTTLPEGVFNGLTALATLYLDSNKLTTLSEGTFTGFTAGLTTLFLYSQNGSDNIKMLLYLGQNGNEVIATVPSGAFADLTVNLSVSGTAESDSPTSIVIPVGKTSASVTLLPQSGQTLTAAFHSSTPLTHTGLSLAGVTIVTAVEQVASFCGRTAAVRNAIIAHADVSATDCQSVTSAMLNGTTGVTATPGITGTLDLSGQSITSLKAGDFAGLTALTTLNLSDNRISTAPPEVFKPLMAMTTLNLDNNQFATLPDNLFKGLTTELTTLTLGNQFSKAGDSTPTQARTEIPLLLTRNGNEVTMTIPAGAPADLTVNLDVTGNAASGSPDTLSLSIGVGETTSGTATLMPAAGATLAVAFASPLVTSSLSVTGADYVGQHSVSSFADGLVALDAQILSHFAITVADSAGQAVSDRIDRMTSRQKPRFNTNGSDFEIPLAGQGSTFTLWLQNSATDLSLTGGAFNWSGDVSGTQFGFDWRSDNSAFLVGLMLQNLDGQFNHSNNLPGTEGLTGYYSIPMDSEHVYFGWMPGGIETSNWLNVWGMIGSGSGSLSGQIVSSTDMSMTHLGFSMVPLNSSDWLSLRVRGELTISSLSVASTGLDVEVTRQRVLVEPTIKDLIASDRHQLVLAGELGFRSDSTSVSGIANPNVGGLPDGAGTELGMKLGYSWRNFDVQVGFRQLSVGADSTGEQYDEDGFYFSLTMGTLFNERGWTASLRPTWGDTGSSVDRLWQATQVSDLSATNSGNRSGSMQAQLSYGMLSPFGSSGLLIPYSQVRTSDSGATNATFGMNLNLNSGWQLHWQYANNTNSNINSGRSASRSTVQSANDNGGEFKLGAALDF